MSKTWKIDPYEITKSLVKDDPLDPEVLQKYRYDIVGVKNYSRNYAGAIYAGTDREATRIDRLLDDGVSPFEKINGAPVYGLYMGKKGREWYFDDGIKVFQDEYYYVYDKSRYLGLIDVKGREKELIRRLDAGENPVENKWNTGKPGVKCTRKGWQNAAHDSK